MQTEELISAARQLSADMNALSFSDPVAYTYNPLEYAWAGHEAYIRRFGHGRKDVLYLGMNPGPFGMAQTGVPFGEIAAVTRGWVSQPPSVVRQRPTRSVRYRGSTVRARR